MLESLDTAKYEVIKSLEKNSVSRPVPQSALRAESEGIEAGGKAVMPGKPDKAETPESSGRRNGWNSFSVARAGVCRQVWYECFPDRDKRQALEICSIIAEVYIYPVGCELNIQGELIPAGVVADVFRNLTYEHIQDVLETYNRLPFTVTAKKPYLRAMLYNSVFELESKISNEVAVDRH